MSLAADLRAALDPAELFRQAFDLEPLDWQRDYLRATGSVAVLKGRQVGGSLAAATLAIATARYRPNVNAVCVSPTLKQSQEVAGKAREGVHRLGIRLAGESAGTLRFPNGSRVLSLPGTPSSVRGWTAALLILDEAAYIAPETWTAALALVATGGRIVVQSTPSTAEGPFHELVTGDDPAWTRLAVRSDEVPTIAPAFLEAQRRTMTPDEYAAEFECEFRPVAALGPRLFSPERIEALFPEAVA